jgi:hypothetical protein
MAQLIIVRLENGPTNNEFQFDEPTPSDAVYEFLAKDPRAGPGTLTDIRNVGVVPSPQRMLLAAAGPYVWRLTPGSFACIIFSLALATQGVWVCCMIP